MDSEIDQFAAEKRADPALVELLRDFAASAPETCRLLLSELSPSSNTLRGYFDLSREIGRRDDRPTFHALQLEAIRKIMVDSGWSRKEKQKRVREQLEKLRYPWRAEREQSIADLIARIKSEFGLRLETPPDLEGDSLSLNLSLKSADELRQISQQLDKLAVSPDLAQLFRLLVGR